MLEKNYFTPSDFSLTVGMSHVTHCFVATNIEGARTNYIPSIVSFSFQKSYQALSLPDTPYLLLLFLGWIFWDDFFKFQPLFLFRKGFPKKNFLTGLNSFFRHLYFDHSFQETTVRSWNLISDGNTTSIVMYWWQLYFHFSIHMLERSYIHFCIKLCMRSRVCFWENGHSFFSKLLIEC